MAKTNWGMNDTIMPDDMNQIGQEINNATNRIDDKVDKVSGKGLSTNDYTTVEKTKLAGIAAGAQVNPGAATASAAGLMSAADKNKLDGVAAGAQVNPGAATTSTAGLMSAADKSKLDGVAAGANNYTHPATHPPSIISQDSSNRFVTDTEKAAWNAKASTAIATGSANGLMPAADKAALNAATNAATASTLVKRDSAGRMKAAAPAAADDVARKSETDAALTAAADMIVDQMRTISMGGMV